MKILCYVLVVLSLVVLGAHFMRAEIELGVIGSLMLIGLLFIRRSWVARLVQAALVLGALEWLRTIYVLTQVRAAQGEPYTRLAVILAVVFVVTAASALLFETPALKRIYGLNRRQKSP